MREEFYLKFMSNIRWTPGQSHLVDTLMKNNQEIAKLLNTILTTGQHNYPELPYVAMLDTLGPSSDLDRLNDSSKANRKNTWDAHDYFVLDASAQHTTIFYVIYAHD